MCHIKLTKQIQHKRKYRKTILKGGAAAAAAAASRNMN